MAMWLPTHLIDRMRCGLWRSIRRHRSRRLFVTVRESEKFEENRTLLGQLLDGGEKEFRIRSELFGSFNSRDWKVFVIVQQIAESRISWNSKFSNMCIRDLDKFYLNWWFYLFYLGQFTPLLQLLQNVNPKNPYCFFTKVTSKSLMHTVLSAKYKF